MKIRTWIYSLKQGVINIKRNKLFSLASIATIAICIFLIGLFYSVFINVNNMIGEAEQKISITVFFKHGISEEEINVLRDKITARAEVKDVEYKSAEEAWEEFKIIYFGEHINLAEGFREDNPLANSASFEIFLNDISMQDVLVSYLNSMKEEGIRQVNSSENTASTISQFGKLVGYVSVALIVILLAVAVFLISNTITMGITVRREEIGIMKLMGASDIFVRAPFMVEGLMIGLIGAIIPIIVLFVLYNRIVVYILAQFQQLSSFTIFLGARDVFHILAPLSLLVGAGIGLVGSMITIRKHLNV
ncbi:MAG: permease-like cell division protein FtsX [Lachnospiraceae bacterium]|nr:permease-like cell division protein FtsX [Lachnospiraceae bacterium]